MQRQSPILIVAAVVLSLVGVAAGQSVLIGGDPGLAVNGSVLTPTTSTGTTGTSTAPATPTTIVGPTTTTTTTPTTTPTTPTTSPTGTPVTPEPTIEQIVSITRTVDPGTAGASAFTVPAGRRLIVTDVLITNTAATPVCGAAVGPTASSTVVVMPPATGTTTTPGTPTTGGTTGTTTGPTTGVSTGVSGTTTGTTGTTITSASGETGTGVLCVPAQTSMSLGLTTGLEFDAGQGVVLSNAAGVPLHYHLRGFLVVTGA